MDRVNISLLPERGYSDRRFVYKHAAPTEQRHGRLRSQITMSWFDVALYEPDTPTRSRLYFANSSGCGLSVASR